MTPAPVSLRELALTFARITSTAVGGGALATIRREVVRRRRWLGEEDFLEVLSLAQLSPGPTLGNIAILVGLRLRGSGGAVVTFLATTLPSLALLAAIAIVLLREASVPLVAAALRGCAAGAVGLMLGNAFDLTLLRARRPLDLVLIGTVAAFVIVRHASLALTLGLFLPLSFVAVVIGKRR